MRLLGSWISLQIGFLLGFGTPLSAADAPPSYERDVRPILAKRCVVCHNVKEIEDPDVSGGLALDSFEALMRGTTKHKVVVAGKSAESELYSRLNETDEERRMPLSDVPIKPLQRDLIRRWIEAGAPRGTPTEVAGLTPSKPALRRVVRSLDLTLSLPAVPPNKSALEMRLKVGPIPGVTSLAFGNDGTTLAVGTYGQIAIWDVPKRELIRMIDDIPGPVLALAHSPDGKVLAAGAGLPSRSGVVRIINANDGSTIREFDGHRDVVSGLAFRPDGKRLVTGSYDATVRFWDLETGKASGVFKGHSDFVYDVAFWPDGKSVISSSKDRTVKRINADSATEMRTYGEHNEDVLAIAVRPDGTGFVSAGDEPSIRSWLPDADKSAKKVGVHGGPVQQLAFSRDGKRLVSASGDKSIRLFDGKTGAHLRPLLGPTEWQYAVAVSPDGRRVAGGGWDGVVRVWDPESAKLEAVLLQPPSISPGAPAWLAIAPDGEVKGASDLRSAVRWVVGGKEVKERPASPSKPK